VLQEIAQLVAPEARVAKDSVQGSTLELAVQRDDQRDGAVWVLQPNVAPTLADLLPTKPLERLDQIGARDDR
jgi:hypothetical protein